MKYLDQLIIIDQRRGAIVENHRFNDANEYTMKSMTFDQSSIMSDANNNSSASLGSAGTMINGSSLCNGGISNPISNSGASGNSNKKINEKYSLRQRQKRQTPVRGVAMVNGAMGTSAAALNEASCDNEPAAVKEKPKPKAAPLSKYRRKTANARERTRMREINCAFENLRRCVPHSLGAGGRNSPNSTNEKLTKITTLRLAMKYIRTLSEALSNPGYDLNFLCANSFGNNNNNECPMSSTVTSNFDHVFGSTVTEAPSLMPVKVRTTVPKVQSRSRQKTKQKPEVVSMETGLPITNHSLEDNPADLGLLLESDGESLHLSEPCLSPLGQHVKPFNCSSASENPLELGLLLESDSDSLQFSEPCLSPLGALDSFNPFGDLLHTEFNEHTSLDMYLT